MSIQPGFPSFRERTKRCGRGAASVEAVVVLPVLIILFASVLYVRTQVLGRQAAESQARACAWAYSMNNCTSVPVGCNARLVSAGASLGGQVESALSEAGAGIAAPIVSAVLRPFLELAFGQALDAKTDVAFERPALYGGGTRSVHGGYHLACNVGPKTLTDVAKDAWNALCATF